MSHLTVEGKAFVAKGNDSHVKEINAVTRTTMILASLLATTALTVPAVAADPIKIGVVTPLSGTYTPIGQQVKLGARTRDQGS